MRFWGAGWLYRNLYQSEVKSPLIQERRLWRPAREGWPQAEKSVYDRDWYYSGGLCFHRLWVQSQLAGSRWRLASSRST